MSQLSTHSLALTLILTLHGPSVGPILAETRLFNPATADLKVHVLIYNYASVTPEKLQKAQEGASTIFRKAGVEVVWIENTALRKGPGAPTLEEMDLILRILPQARTTLASRSALGEALPCQSMREGASPVCSSIV